MFIIPYINEHSARITSPDKYIRIRRQNNKFGSGIHAIWGVKKNEKTELQAIRFDRKKFTTTEAKAWLKKNKIKYTSFEAASGTSRSIFLDGLDRLEKKLNEFNELIVKFL